jgi:GDP-4-dehydro-6-deoxy-D-mannose reductase
VSDAVLVTGAAGFAGSHLVEYLTRDAEVVAWSRCQPAAPLLRLARWERVDLLDRARVRDAVQHLRPSRVYHCAGAAHVAHSWRDTAEPLAKNALATHYLLDALRRADRRCRVLIPGSATVYAASPSPLREDSPLAPASPYAVSKLAQEQLGLRAGPEDGIDVVLTRSFNHTGARQSAAFAAPGMARQIALVERGAIDPEITAGNLDAQRDLTDVRDVVRAYALLMERGASGVIYNVASGVGRSMRTVLDALVARARVPVQVRTDPALLRPHDVPVLVGDASRLREATGWAQAISFDRMLDDLLDYWRQETA